MRRRRGLDPIKSRAPQSDRDEKAYIAIGAAEATEYGLEPQPEDTAWKVTLKRLRWEHARTTVHAVSAEAARAEARAGAQTLEWRSGEHSEHPIEAEAAHAHTGDDA